jgi:hypothetical protein
VVPSGSKCFSIIGLVAGVVVLATAMIVEWISETKLEALPVDELIVACLLPRKRMVRWRSA